MALGSRFIPLLFIRVTGVKGPNQTSSDMASCVHFDGSEARCWNKFSAIGDSFSSLRTQTKSRRVAQSSSSSKMRIQSAGRNRRAAVSGTMPNPTPSAAIRQIPSKLRRAIRFLSFVPSLLVWSSMCVCNAPSARQMKCWPNKSAKCTR